LRAAGSKSSGSFDASLTFAPRREHYDIPDPAEKRRLNRARSPTGLQSPAPRPANPSNTCDGNFSAPCKRQQSLGGPSAAAAAPGPRTFQADFAEVHFR